MQVVEAIPDDDLVYRHVFHPFMSTEEEPLIWRCVFQFQEKYGFAESVVWSKYTPTMDDVHELGRQKAEKSREERPERPHTYVGCLEAICRVVRNIKSSNGHGFEIVHEPSEGTHHAHIRYLPAAGDFSRADRIELKSLLQKAFSDLIPV